MIVLKAEKHLSPDTELSRAISADELLIGIEEDIRKAYRDNFSIYDDAGELVYLVRYISNNHVSAQYL